MNFWDKLGRLHTKPVTEADQYPTNNAYIYTAYHAVLNLNPKDLKRPEPAYLPEAMPFSRHPDQACPPISHDELTGVSILSKEKAKAICEYLKNNYNQFCDLPGFVPTSFFKLNWFKVIAAFNKLRKEDNTRRASVNYPEIHPLAFWQRPEHMWMYKRCAGIKPNILERIYFTLARTISIIRWKKEEPNLLLFFSLKHLKQEDNLGIEGQIVQLYLNTVVGDMYEDIDDMLKYATRDLPAEYYAVHPWIIG